MMVSARASQTIKLAILALCLFTTIYYLATGRSTLGNHEYKEIYQTAVLGKKAAFVERVLASEIDGPFDNSTLVALCAATQWTPGLFFQCESPEGAIASVRNIVLNCVRYAIEAGATGFVVPEILIHTSSSKTLTPVPFSHFFDTEYFTSTLSSSCPQIHLYSHVNDLYDVPSTANALPLTSSLLSRTFIAEKVLAAPGSWSSTFRSFLNATHPVPFSASKPVLVKLNKPFLEFPLSYDDPSFVASFPRILRFREDTRRLAASVLYALSTTHNLALTPHLGIQPAKFFGAHLRTGADAMAAGWTSYEMQSENYLATASHLQLPLIYLASDNQGDMQAFSEQAATNSILVTHKDTLFQGKDFEAEASQLKTLTWDQRQLVDYEVLLHASSFAGTWESSLSWNVAMRRHVVMGQGKWLGLEGPGESVQQPNVVVPPSAAGIGGGTKERDATSPADAASQPTTAASEKRAVAEMEGSSSSISDGLSGTAKPTFGSQAAVGETTFRDGLSVMFGPVGEGRRVMLSMWP